MGYLSIWECLCALPGPNSLQTKISRAKLASGPNLPRTLVVTQPNTIFNCRWGPYSFFVCELLTRAEAVFHPPRSLTSFSTEAKCSILVSEPLRASFCWKEDICSRPARLFNTNVWKSPINPINLWEVWRLNRIEKNKSLQRRFLHIQDWGTWGRSDEAGEVWLGESLLTGAFPPACPITSRHIHTHVLSKPLKTTQNWKPSLEHKEIW